MNDLLEKFLKYTSSNILGMLGISLYVVADAFFIAYYVGAKGLIAVNLSLPLFSLMTAFSLALGVGGASRFAMHKSLDRDTEAYKIFSVALKINLLLAFIFFLGFFFPKDLALAFGANDQSLEVTRVYMKVILFFAPSYMINHMVTVFVRNDGRPRLAMAAMLSASFLNIILDFVFLKYFSWGIFGAALATGLSASFSWLLIVLAYLKAKIKFFYFDAKISLAHIRDLINFGLPTFIVDICVAILITGFNFVILKTSGNPGLAAYGIIANLNYMFMAVLNGIAFGTQPLISENYGRNNFANINRLIKYQLGLSVLGTLVIYSLSYIFTDPLVSIFLLNGGQDAYDLAFLGLRIYFAGSFFAGINIVLVSSFAAIEELRKSFVISMARGLVFSLPLLIIMADLFAMKGIWASFVLAEFFTMLIGIYFLKTSKVR
ncbi:MAG: MATE family efflux transporter [Bacillota bacterium]|nr:MATE family efflux transporter [Bacillota bacterium]